MALRPRRIPSGVWTCLSAAVVLALGWVRLPEVGRLLSVASGALLFLLGLLVLSALLEASGFFDWAAILAARSAGSGAALLRNVLVLGALITFVLSLDTTAVILTPLVVGAVQRLQLPARAYVLACAFVSSVASLLLPVSNLTNLLLAAHVPAARFARPMLVPQLLTLAVLWVGLHLAFRRELARPVDGTRLPAATTVIPDRPFFAAACAVLAFLLVGYFVGPALGVPVWVVAGAGALLLGAVGFWRGRLGAGALRHLSLGVFPFVLGLFVLVQAVENLGLEAPLLRWLREPRPSWAAEAGIVAASTVAASLLNNLPAALMVRSILEHAAGPFLWTHAALLGTNVGACLTPHGTLATLLVLSAAERRGVHVPGLDVMRIAVWLVPAMLVVGLIGFQV